MMKMMRPGKILGNSSSISAFVAPIPCNTSRGGSGVHKPQLCMISSTASSPQHSGAQADNEKSGFRTTNTHAIPSSTSLHPLKSSSSSVTHSSSIAANNVDRTLKRVTPVERRPELVGGVPLWLLFGAAQQFKNFTTSLISSSLSATTTRPTTTSRKTSQKNDNHLHVSSTPSSPPPLPPPTSATLHQIAEQLENEISTLNADLDAAKQTAELRASEITLLKEQLQQINARDFDKEQSETLKHMFGVLCATQTRASRAEKELAQTYQTLVQAMDERNAAKQDVTKTVAVCALFLAMVGGIAVREPSILLGLLK